MPKKLILIVIDGLTPAAFELAADDDRTPALKFLAANGAYTRGVSTFPSLTPVCLSSIATGAHPDVHRIPHLVWYHRGERRIVEYGSSFAALRATGLVQGLLGNGVPGCGLLSSGGSVLTSGLLAMVDAIREILASIARFAQRTLDFQAAPVIQRTTRSGH